MISSMTGFGRGIAASPDRKITVEIKSLNGKQLDLQMRVPSYFREYEVNVRNVVATHLQRGKADVCIQVEQLGEDAPSIVKTGVLQAYKRQIEEAAAALEVSAPSDWFSVLMRMPDVLQTETREVGRADEEALMAAVEQASEALKDYRIKEGLKLQGFFVEKIRNISTLLAEVDPFEKERVDKVRQKLEDQLSRLNGVEYDRERLEQELIYYIEKLDVTEEKTRLRAHLSYFMETMDAAESQGKKLGFIAQEIGREINTLGSKANNADMQKIVVRMKDELEQIKEQILNVL